MTWWPRRLKKKVFPQCFATSSHPFFSMRNRAGWERPREKSVTEVEGFICGVGAKSPLSPRGLLSFPQFRVKNIQSSPPLPFFLPRRILSSSLIPLRRILQEMLPGEWVSPSNFSPPSFPLSTLRMKYSDNIMFLTKLLMTSLVCSRGCVSPNSLP